MARLHSADFPASEQVFSNTGSNSRCRFFDRVASQMRVTCRRFHLCMAEKPADHRQAFSESKGARRPRVPQVMEPHVIQRARLRTIYHGSLIFRMCVPAFLPTMTQGFLAMRGRSARIRTAAGDRGIIFGPVFESARRSILASRSTFSHRSVSTSFRLHPVRMSKRIAATACAETPPCNAASLSTEPRRRNSSSVRKRSCLRALYLGKPRHGLALFDTRPHVSAWLNIRDRMPTT